MNTAQKVRLWIMLAAMIVTLVGMLVIASTNGIYGTSYDVLLSRTDWNDIVFFGGLGMFSAVTLAVLGPITLYRFLHPIVKAAPPAPAPGYAQHPYPPQPQYPAAPAQYPNPHNPYPQQPTPPFRPQGGIS